MVNLVQIDRIISEVNQLEEKEKKNFSIKWMTYLKISMINRVKKSL